MVDTLERNHVDVGSGDGHFHVLDIGTGEKVWEFGSATKLVASSESFGPEELERFRSLATEARLDDAAPRSSNGCEAWATSSEVTKRRSST